MSIAVCNFCTAELEKVVDGKNKPTDVWDKELHDRNIFWCKDCLGCMVKFGSEVF